MEEGDGGIAEGSVGGRRGMEAALFLDRLHHRSLPPFLPPPPRLLPSPLVTRPASAHERSWEKWTHTHTHTLSNASHARLSLGSGSEGTKSHTHTHTITWCRWDIRCSLSSEESANEPALKIFTRNVSVSRPSERTGTLSSGKTAAHLKFVYSLCVLLFIFLFFYWSAQQVDRIDLFAWKDFFQVDLLDFSHVHNRNIHLNPHTSEGLDEWNSSIVYL